MISLALVIVAAIIIAAALSCIPTDCDCSDVSSTLETPAPTMSERERRYHSDDSIGR